MKKVLTLEEFDQIIEGNSHINEMNEHDQEFITSVIYESFDVNDDLDKEINEAFNIYISEGVISNFITLAKNPITGIKLVNNAKKLARAQIMNATAKIDFEKKKQAAEKSKDADNPEKVAQAKKSMEIAKAAYDTKKEVAADQITAIEDRMTELSKDDPKLSKIAALLKTKARVEANKKLIKMLDAEERKQMQITIKNQEEKAREAEADMADYIRDEKAKETEKGETGGEDTDQKVQDLQNRIKEIQDKIGQTDDVETKTKLGLEKAQLNLQKAKLTGEKEDIAQIKVKLEEARVKYTQEKTPENYLEWLKTSLKYEESVDNPSSERIANRKQQIKDQEEKIKTANEPKTPEKKTGDKVEQEIADLTKKKDALVAKIADQKEGVETSNKLYTDALNKRDSIEDKESDEYAKASDEYTRISSERQADQAKLAGLQAQLKDIADKISDLQSKKKK